VQILELKNLQDVFDMGFKADVLVGEMMTVTDSSQRRNDQLVPAITHWLAHLAPKPSSRPSAMCNDDRSHRSHHSDRASFRLLARHPSSSIHERRIANCICCQNGGEAPARISHCLPPLGAIPR